MKINKILLYNFNSFEGMNEFDFTSEDENKNIILVGGKNGAGKTSLFTAIKIALYGPLAFGYVGINSHYVSKIKDCINSKAFQTDKVQSRIELTISLMVERELRNYVIVREWDYSGQKLIENYTVSEDGKLMDKRELSYFQNYLQGMIPPELFEFFLFDGEAVGDIFATSAYNKYVRNAVYTLCGLDIYELIRKYTSGFVGKAVNEDEKHYVDEYEKLKDQVDACIAQREVISQRVAETQLELDGVETELFELETAFKNAGGITKKERTRLAKEYEEAERTKTESQLKIRLFMEGLLPFFIVKEFNDDIRSQLEIEDKVAIYQYIEQRLDRDELASTLGKKSSKTLDSLLNAILSQFKPTEDTTNTEPLFDLSREENGRVSAVMSSVDTFDAEDMVRTIESKKEALDKTTEINRILKSAMADDDAAEFAEKENGLLRLKEEINKRLYDDKSREEELNAQITELTALREKARQTMLDKVQGKHVYELSNGLAIMMNSLLSEKSVSIKKELEELIVSNLKLIYRKNNLITHIEIDDNFQLNLYQDSVYSSQELRHLLKNLGKDGFSLAIGKDGKDKLFREYAVKSFAELSEKLKKNGKEKIQLFKNIDLSRLSKGERQIFILSLYWAIIKLSGKDIPFIIDTPYARIDANHRKEISQKFFPTISKQVVILSTDEEINEEYYKIIKPHIAREYLLINDENQNKTSVETRYFFGE
jgi:DNA sulfur modification protein dndD